MMLLKEKKDVCGFLAERQAMTRVLNGMLCDSVMALCFYESFTIEV